MNLFILFYFIFKKYIIYFFNLIKVRSANWIVSSPRLKLRPTNSFLFIYLFIYLLLLLIGHFPRFLWLHCLNNLGHPYQILPPFYYSILPYPIPKMSVPTFRFMFYTHDLTRVLLISSEDIVFYNVLNRRRGFGVSSPSRDHDPLSWSL